MYKSSSFINSFIASNEQEKNDGCIVGSLSHCSSSPSRRLRRKEGHSITDSFLVYSTVQYNVRSLFSLLSYTLQPFRPHFAHSAILLLPPWCIIAFKHYGPIQLNAMPLYFSMALILSFAFCFSDPLIHATIPELN